MARTRVRSPALPLGALLLLSCGGEPAGTRPGLARCAPSDGGSGCPPGEVCAADRTCRRRCSDDTECLDGQVCHSGLCSLPGGGERDGGGATPDARPGDPAILVSPSPLDFGFPLVGTQTTLQLTVANVGQAPLLIRAILLVEFDPLTEYSIPDYTYPIVIDRDPFLVDVTLRPVDGMPDTGQLTIVNNDPDPEDFAKLVPLISDVKGTPSLRVCVLSSYPPAADPPGDDECQAVPSLDFGTVAYGASSTRVFALHNAGDGNRTIQVNDLDVTDADPHFVIERFTREDGVESAATLPVYLSPAALDGVRPRPANRLYVRVTFTADGVDGSVPHESVRVRTNLDPPDDVANVPMTGRIDGCRPDHYDLDPAVPGCEYACVVTPGGDETVCNGRDDDCDGRMDEDYVPYTCGTGICQRSSTCTGGVESCTPGAPAADDTTCNCLDDDCNGAVDDGWVPYDCGLGACERMAACDPVGCAPMCVAGPPAAEVCNGVDDNCNGSIDEDDPGDATEGSDFCDATATPIATLTDEPATSVEVHGLIHVDDHDWYLVDAVDVADGCSDAFDLCAFFTDNPGGKLRFDMHRGGCPPLTAGACAISGAGCSCVANPDEARWHYAYTEGTDCGLSDAPVDMGGPVWVHIYLADGETPTCAPYTLIISNGTCP